MFLFDYDAELIHYHERLMTSLDLRPDDHVLDVGCGSGLTTRDAARAATSGSALGIDVSGPMLEQARRQAAAEGLDNVTFVRADAQEHGFRPERFSVAVSRFGTMFFSDPLAAFTNVGRALRPGGRFTQLVWQAADRQEWHTGIRAALSDGPGSLAPPPAGPFTLADPRVVSETLAAAGFTAVDIADVREPVLYGPDAERACTAVLQLRLAQDSLTGLDTASAERALGRLRAMLAAHETDEGVWFDSRAWLITARRGSP